MDRCLLKERATQLNNIFVLRMNRQGASTLDNLVNQGNSDGYISQLHSDWRQRIMWTVVNKCSGVQAAHSTAHGSQYIGEFRVQRVGKRDASEARIEIEYNRFELTVTTDLNKTLHQPPHGFAFHDRDSGPFSVNVLGAQNEVKRSPQPRDH